MPPMNPKGPTMALQDLKNWFADKGLRIAHAATLARFEKQLYDHKDNTITPVEASEKDSWQWQSMDVGRWPHRDMLGAWNRMRSVHQGLGLTFSESAQWMMVNSSTHAPVAPSLEGMFA